MNRWIRSASTLALVLLSSLLFANHVVVKGTVKFTNGIVVPNFPVVVSTDTASNDANCRQSKSVTSNPNGVYEAALDCTTKIVKVVILYKDCMGNAARIVKEVPASEVVEYHISLCTPSNCAANFGVSLVNTVPGTVLVSSANAHASGPWPDEIVSRKWTWGDGTATDGNLVELKHTYQQPGTYTICLVIKTRNGCESKECHTISIGALNNDCVANFGFGHNNQVNGFQFSDSSRTLTGDEIVYRRWTFGDQTNAIDGNLKNVDHVFAGPGTYEVCLQIKTRQGCEKRTCKLVTITADPCKANFVFEILPVSSANAANSIRFNSSNSFAGNPASNILSRRWDFGDGTVIEGNNVIPVHTYNHPGTYTVCLTIKTAANCINTTCKTVVVPDNRCKALFKWEPIPGSAVNPPKSFMAFNGGASHGSSNTDNIIGRRWTFGDGTALESLDSTVKHGYDHAGTYTVCLYIKTSSGCIDSICNTVVVPNPPTTACVPGFTWKQDYLKFTFNSSITAVATGDQVIKRTWYFGDGTSMDGNVVEPVHTYTHPGTYEVCLQIVTDRGCQQKICKQVFIGTCEAVFRFEPTQGPATNPAAFYFKFMSGASHGASNNYPVIGRRWTFGDGTVLESNDSNLVHKYQSPGQYQVCLTIKTSDGCQHTTCKTVVIQNTSAVPACQAKFEGTFNGLKALFNSSGSLVAAGDSIVKRTWIFGDGTKEDGNHINADHVYLNDGQYEVCLVINTKLGCESKICKPVLITSQQRKCFPVFRFENVGGKKIVFNSNASYSSMPNDIIVKRVWSFGDGMSLDGNIVSPSHEYRYAGTYTVCLRIITAAGCETAWCQQVRVDGQQYGDSSHIKLVSIYPNPAKFNLYTVIWNKQAANVQGTLAVYDIYGTIKWSRSLILPQGNSTWPVYVGNLPAGPYILRLTTQYGVHRMQFFKSN